MFHLPTEVESLINSINSFGYDAFVVGGWVRDALLGVSSKDIDICTNALPEVIYDLFESYKPTTSFIHHGSVSFNHAGYSIEITTFRREFDHKDGRHPGKVEFVDDLKDDLMRRDFTINTLCYHPTRGLIDLLGGVEDLRLGILRTVGDPIIRFEEDLLRIVRLVRFKSYLNFSIDVRTLDAATTMSRRLSHLPLSAWRAEFLKIVCSPNLLRVALEDAYLFQNLIPELKECYHFDQYNPYHNFSLYEHTMRVSACLPNRIELRLAGLFHDLGKLRVQVIDADGIGHYRTHAKESETIASDYLLQFQVGKAVTGRVMKLIEYHDVKLQESLSSIYGFAFEHGISFTRDLIEFKRCDNQAKSNLAAYQLVKCDVFDELLNQVELLPLNVSDLLIKNQDVLDCGVEQNRVSAVLDALMRRVVLNQCGNDENRQRELLWEVVSDGIY